jgi:pSer/pThr/pTyr-binding forkhead associated (FHA) protein
MDRVREHNADEWLDTGEAVIPLRLMVLPEQRPVEVAKPAVLVGRHSDVQLRLCYPDVSRRHCRLVYADGLWQIEDLDSLNGLFVNGERMHATTLYEGDRIRVGEATLVVTEAPAASAPERSKAEVQVLRSIAEALPAA